MHIYSTSCFTEYKEITARDYGKLFFFSSNFQHLHGNWAWLSSYPVHTTNKLLSSFGTAQRRPPKGLGAVVLVRTRVRLYLHLHKRTAARGKMRKWFKLTKHRRRSPPWNRSFPVLRTCEVDFLTLCAVSKTTVWICMMWFRAVILKIAILAREIQPTCCSTLLFERCSYSA